MDRPTSDLARLLGYLKPRWRGIAAASACSVLGAAATAAYAYLLGPLLKSLLSSASAPGLPTWLAGAVVALACVKAGSQLLYGGWMQVVGQGLVADLREDSYGRLLHLPPRFFDQRHSGELLSRFTNDVGQVELAVSQALGSYLKDGLQVLALLIVCFGTDRRLFVLAFFVLPATVFPISRFAKSLKKVAGRTQAGLGRLSELCAELLHNLSVVQAYRAAGRALQRFELEQRSYLLTMRRSLLIRAAFTPTLEILGIAGTAVAIGFGAKAIGHEPTLAPKLLSFLAAALLLYQPLKAIAGTQALVAQGMGAARRLFELSDLPTTTEAGKPAGPLRGELVLDSVRLSYDGRTEALRGLCLSVPAGKRCALVGSSGAGKTTVFAALLGFAEVSSGRILWDGEPVSSFALSSIRAQIAWVPQDPILFTGTVRENLKLGRPDAEEEELWEALRLACAERFVRELPSGLEQAVGERGGRLSGGQRQRLALARAFLRRPSLLLLDEPTSALDAATEEGLARGLSELTRDRTTLVIAHRLSTVRGADRIFVVESGQVVESGNHEGLLAQRGRYAELVAHGELKA